jgi:hypothetical protein
LKQQTQKLEALQKAVKLIGSMKDRKQLEYKEAMGLLEVINDYNYALGLLDDYDYKRLKISQTSKDERFVLSYEFAVEAVNKLKERIGSSDIFGTERDKSFKSSISSIYQTFDGKDLYPSIDEKAANLLYFMLRIILLWTGINASPLQYSYGFLEKNGILLKNDGSKRIADNALVG